MKTTLALTLAVLLCACDQIGATRQPPPKYQIVANTEGGAWRLNTETGEMMYCLSFMPVIAGPACRPAVNTTGSR